jgi:hypothetical protein
LPPSLYSRAIAGGAAHAATVVFVLLFALLPTHAPARRSHRAAHRRVRQALTRPIAGQWSALTGVMPKLTGVMPKRTRRGSRPRLAKATDYVLMPSANTWRVRAPRQSIGWVQRSRRRGRTNFENRDKTMPVDHFTHNTWGFTTCTAMCGSGPRTAGTTATWAIRAMVVQGRQGTAVGVSRAVVPGVMPGA